MTTLRLTTSQALVRYLAAQKTLIDGAEVPLFGGVFAIFGHGNVAGLGEALEPMRETLPTYRAHNEQAMAHTAIAYAKAHNRQRMMACTTSIGPGAANMVTAAALAHVNRLPVLLLPGDSFASRFPDPVLQQVEAFTDPTVTTNDCFRPVSRYWDRITRPEQLLTSLPVAIATLTDPVSCGPVTLALPQDVQAEAFDYPEAFFAPRVHELRRPGPDPRQLEAAATRLAAAAKPLIVAGGGVHYGLACDSLAAFAQRFGIPVAETQAGKGALPSDHPCAAGAIGVTGSTVANRLAAEADAILAVGTRLSDFTTGSRTVFADPDATLIGLNVTPFDACKHGALPLVSDAGRGLDALAERLGSWSSAAAWQDLHKQEAAKWDRVVQRVTAATDAPRPTDAQVVGAVNRTTGPEDVVVCAAGTLPAELHKLWRTAGGGTYHVEYGYSCMGYEIAGGIGVKMAHPDRDVYVLLGDGSYLMLNSEIATSVMLGHKLILVILDNRGFGCITRLQKACGGARFNNLLEDAIRGPSVGPAEPCIDYAAHAASLGAHAEKVRNIAELEAALKRAKASEKTYAIVIDTEPLPEPYEGGSWWEVAVAEVSERAQVRDARETYEAAIARRTIR